MEATVSSSYAPLPGQPEPAISLRRRPRIGPATRALALSFVFLASLVALLILNQTRPDRSRPVLRHPPETGNGPSRGTEQGVSEKAVGRRRHSPDGGHDASYNWTNAMFAWQRTGYHFQPQKNWMNDPNGPLYHMGWYHLFYQYNPDSAVWGNITWGHAVSTDLIHWLYLPFAMVPDRWFDINGVWTGSSTRLPDGRIVVLYTGDSVHYVQVQNLAYPANLSDPLLLRWVKYPGNPVILPPPGIGGKYFRDPTTAWAGPNGTWRVAIGSKVGKTGVSLAYETTNFTAYRLLDGVLHGVPGTGMWECVDFYPVSTAGADGLDTSANGPGVKHVLKASLDDNKHDYYAIGTYDPVADKWRPDNPEEDVGIGPRVDYGRYYASKTFYDQSTRRRILLGWTRETDSEADDLAKGWASVQTIPRTVVFDQKTATSLLQWPVEEVEKLRLNLFEFDRVEVPAGSVVPLEVGPASQLDIVAEFGLDKEALATGVAAEEETDSNGYNCSGGATRRGAFGPFGLLVVASETLSELTPVYFYVAKGKKGNLRTFFCADETRSSKASDVVKAVYGSTVPVLDGEKLSLRSLVDHSTVESFAQGGRISITSRIYPTEAILGAARLFVFNNATGANVTATVKAWHMDSAFIRPFQFDRV